MDESKECPYCGDDERPCVCDDMEAHGRAMRARELATARAEAALAEREACARWFDDRAANYELWTMTVMEDAPAFGGRSVAQNAIESLAQSGADARLHAQTIRARTTPATLSTETLAAIVEARGLRVVKARAEVIAFAEAMESQLVANDHKRGWKDDSPLDLHQRISEESAELRAEVVEHHRRDRGAQVLREAADVANFAMMVADVCGCLDARSKDGAK